MPRNPARRPLRTVRLTLARWAVGLGMLLGFGPAVAAPDYGLWDGVLVANVRNGYVDYDGIRADPRFEAFLAEVARTDPAPTERNDAIAFYVNAYNAFAVRGILDGYSPATRFGRFRYFKTMRFPLAGADTSLDEIEHERLRPLGDARIHFAIVCGAISCPRLASRAYLPETLDPQLDEAARKFVNDATRNRFDVAQRTAFLSSIFDWFRADFEKSAGSLPAFLAPFVDEPAARAALLEGRLAIRFLRYDWDLNGRYQGDAAP